MISTWQSWILTFRNKATNPKAFLTLIILFLCSLTPLTAQAFEALYFREAKNFRERQALSFTQKENQATDIQYFLAPIDLNNDSLDEYVTRARSCNEKTLCLYHVIAFMEDEPITLLTVNARKIIAQDTHQYGVRDLFVFNNEMNDFQKLTYKWNPSTYVYEQKLR